MSYFEFLENQHKEGKKIKDIFTINDVAYTTLDYALQQIGAFTKEEDALKEARYHFSEMKENNIIKQSVFLPLLNYYYL